MTIIMIDVKGKRFTSVSSHVLNADRIKRFASEFDPQPMDTAARLLFAGLVAGPHRTLPRATTSTSDSLMREGRLGSRAI
jgi:hypothetical protein